MLSGLAETKRGASQPLPAVLMSSSTLAGLRAMAAARTPPAPLPAARAAARGTACWPSAAAGLWQRRPRSNGHAATATHAAAAALAGTVEALRPAFSARSVQQDELPASPPPAVQGSQSSLLRSIRELLKAGRPAVAAHILQEEWALTSRCLEDAWLRWAALPAHVQGS